MNNKSVAQAVGNIISSGKGIAPAAGELVGQQKQEAPPKDTKNNE